MSNNSAQTLVLIDHDGTLCQTSEFAYESIKYAVREAVKAFDGECRLTEDSWSEIFEQTKGTTEKNLARVICYRLSVPIAKILEFEKRFYLTRANYFRNMKSCKEYIYDTYYPDATNLVYSSIKNNNFSTALVTGNPRIVIEERMPGYLKQYFSDKRGNLKGAFGDERTTREELLQLAIERHLRESKKFQVKTDESSFATNIVYIGDSRSDFFAALNKQIKIIWIPARSIQAVKCVLAQDYLAFLMKTMSEHIHVTNNLDLPETKQFIGLEDS